MPQKGWAVLTIRVTTSRKVKELDHKRGMSVDEYINSLIKGGKDCSHKADWAVCSVCEARVKYVNLLDHKARMHPAARLTSQKSAGKP